MGRLGRMALLLVPLLAAAGGAGAAECPRPPNPAFEVRITKKIAATVYRHDLDHTGIGALFTRSPGTSAPGRGRSVFGLTLAHTATTVAVKSMMAQRGDGAWCTWLTGVDVELAISDQTVYIARDFAENTCQYTTIRNHEDQHVGRNVATLQAFAPAFERAMRQAAQGLSPIVTRQRPGNDLPAPLRLAMRTVERQMEEERYRLNAALDTPENYRRTEAQCPHW